MVSDTLTLAANIVTLGATKVATASSTSVKIAGQYYEGATKNGKLFLKAVKKMQTYQVDGLQGARSYLKKVKKTLKSQTPFDVATQGTSFGMALRNIAYRAMQKDFELITSPEIFQELKEKLNPQNLEYIIQEYTKLHLASMSEADGWDLGKTIGGVVEMFDLTGVSSLVNDFAHPVCPANMGALDYKDPKSDGSVCTKSSDCESDCCSNGKCTPSSSGFKTNICAGTDPHKSLNNGATCLSSDRCLSGCCAPTPATGKNTCSVMPTGGFDYGKCIGLATKSSLEERAPCKSSLECKRGCCSPKYSFGEHVCTPFEVGFHPQFNQCVGELYPAGEPCTSSFACGSGCCSSKYSNGVRKCTPSLGTDFDPISNQCLLY